MRYAALALLALAACSDTYDEDRVRIDHGITSLTGQPISRAVERFGVPSSSSRIGDATAYVWRVENIYYPGDDVPLACEVRIMADASDHIVRGDFNGSNYACQMIARRMN